MYFSVEKAHSQVFYVIASSVSILLHELSHTVMAFRYGLKPKKLTVALYAFITPMLYIRMNGIYFVKPIQRVFIWIAGSFMNMFLALVSLMLAMHTGGLPNTFFMTAAICNLILCISSLMPLYISDGYYILATLLKTPNLRQNSFSQTLKFFRGNFTAERAIYVVYCLAFVGMLAYFLVLQIAGIVTFVAAQRALGYGVLRILRNYMNIFIFIAIGIASRVLTPIVKKHRQA